LKQALDEGYTVLAIWNAVECKKCASDFWTVHEVLYAFSDEPMVKYYALAIRL
jgi:hypothetical protein